MKGKGRMEASKNFGAGALKDSFKTADTFKGSHHAHKETETH